MDDKNKNTIPGTLRTLKTDLSLDTDPQDRLQQSGNFLQARPNLDMPVTPPEPITSSPVVEDSPPSTVQPEMKDIKPKSPSAGSYSWGNTNNTPQGDLNINMSSLEEPVKSGFTALDDSMDIPLSSNIDKSVPIPPSIKPPEPAKAVEAPLPGMSSNSNSFNFDTQQDAPSKKISSFKGLFSVVILIILVGLIGGGIYLYLNTRTTPAPITDNDGTDNPTPTTPVVEAISPIQVNKKIDVAFLDTEPIRKTIITSLNTEKDALVEVNLTKDGSKVNIIDLASALGITIPVTITGDVLDYWIYVYNQQGIYKLTAAIQLKETADASVPLSNWSASIPRDMAGFSLNSSSRIVTSPEIKRSTITANTGKVFNNYYYNYTSNTDSIDVSSNGKYIIMASSQDSMKYITGQIK